MTRTNLSNHLSYPKTFSKNFAASEWSSKALQLPWPTKMMVYGASESGKTTLMCQMLDPSKNLFVNPIDNMMYVNPMLKEGCIYKPSQTVQVLTGYFPNIALRDEVPHFHGDDFLAWVATEKKNTGENTLISLYL